MVRVLPAQRILYGLTESFSIDEHSCAKFCMVHNRGTACARRVADNAPTLVLQA